MNHHFLSKRVAHQLGMAGIVPFVALALACWIADAAWLGVFIRGQLAYGVLALSCLGGLHWGAALVSEDLSAGRTKKALSWGVIPGLGAWLATMVGGFGFAVLMAGFVAAYQVDKRLFAWYRMPEWLIRLRFILTCIAVAALALTVIAADVRG